MRRESIAKKRRAVAVLLAAASFLALCGCETSDDLAEGLVSAQPSAEPSVIPQIIVPVGPASVEAFGVAYSSTTTLNPISGTSRLNLEIAPLMYEGLFELNADFEAEKLLCERFERDGETWTFTLRDGVSMSDGEPLTASDVKYSLDLARASERYRARLECVRTVAAADESTVVITTYGECGRLELLLDVPIIRDGSGDEYAPAGSGLYEFVDAGDESYLRTSAARRGETSISRIQLVDTPEAELMISNFEQGLISVASYDATATDRIDYGGDYEEWSYPTTNMVYLCFGARLSAELRRVLSRSINRAEIAESDFFGCADATSDPANPASGLAGECVGFSLERSADELAELGAQSGADGALTLGGARLSVRLIVPEENDCKLAAAERIAADWRQLGLDVALDALCFADFSAALAAGNFDAALCETKLTADFSLERLVGSGGALNYGGHSSEETDALLAAYRAADAEGIGAAADALYDHIAESAPVAPILFERGSLIARRGAVGAADPAPHDLYRGVARWRLDKAAGEGVE